MSKEHPVSFRPDKYHRVIKVPLWSKGFQFQISRDDGLKYTPDSQSGLVLSLYTEDLTSVFSGFTGYESGMMAQLPDYKTPDFQSMAEGMSWNPPTLTMTVDGVTTTITYLYYREASAGIVRSFYHSRTPEGGMYLLKLDQGRLNDAFGMEEMSFLLVANGPHTLPTIFPRIFALQEDETFLDDAVPGALEQMCRAGMLTAFPELLPDQRDPEAIDRQSHEKHASAQHPPHDAGKYEIQVPLWRQSVSEEKQDNKTGIRKSVVRSSIPYRMEFKLYASMPWWVLKFPKVVIDWREDWEFTFDGFWAVDADQPAWEPNKQYPKKEIVLASNGRAYFCIRGGVSGKEEPGWPGDGATVEDGCCRWRDLGVPGLNGVIQIHNTDHPWPYEGRYAGDVTVNGMSCFHPYPWTPEMSRTWTQFRMYPVPTITYPGFDLVEHGMKPPDGPGEVILDDVTLVGWVADQHLHGYNELYQYCTPVEEPSIQISTDFGYSRKLQMWTGSDNLSHTVEEPPTSPEGKAYSAIFAFTWFTEEFDYTPSSGGGVGGYTFLGEFTGTMESPFTDNASFIITPLPEAV